MAGVDEEISHYEEALDSLDASSASGLAHDTLRALIARDQVVLALADKSGLATPAAIERLEKNDRRLANLAVKLDSNLGGETLKSWRRSVSPDKNSWWWALDDLAIAKHAKANRVWALIAIVLLTVAFGIATDTFNLFRSVGENTLSTVGNMAQVVLAIIAAGAFTPSGRKWLVDSFSRLGIKNRRFQGAARTLLALAVLGLTIGIRYYLPGLVADHFMREGDQLVAQGLAQGAVHEYQQAASLQPYSTRVHMALAGALEKEHDYDKAQEEYKRVVSLYNGQPFDDPYYIAQSKVARFTIMRDKDYAAALLVLVELQTKIELVSNQNRKLFQGLLFNYRGWVDLELKNYELARDELRAAIGFRDRDSAEAHYLLALAYEALMQQKEAEQEWLAVAKVLQQKERQAEEMPPDWKSRAQEKVAKQASRLVSASPSPSPSPSTSPSASR